MNSLAEAREGLATALMEWRDAGGSIATVVDAFEELAREIATDEIAIDKPQR